MKRKSVSEKTIRKAVCYLMLGVLTVLFMFPLYWFFLNSVKSYEQIFQFPPKFWVLPLRLENYPEAYQYPALQFGQMLKNSAVITLVSVFGAVLSSTIVAYGFSRLRWRGRDAVFALVILTMIIPTEVVLTPLYFIYNRLHLLDTWFPIIAPYFFAKPFYTFMIRQNMMGIPIEMDESAVIDGCNVWQRLFYVILPQVKPALLSVMIMAMQDQWNNYLEPLIYINSNSKQTISVGLTFFSGMYNIQWNLVFAAAVIVALPILIVFVFLQKYFIQGVVVSGVKG
ncbi:MAG: carbohydrate ABC transporter permease [Lachnospiraceae bacterium]|nr:carbohydrate ABC transporter permease [Lachnospiraceae bacterium]